VSFTSTSDTQKFHLRKRSRRTWLNRGTVTIGTIWEQPEAAAQREPAATPKAALIWAAQAVEQAKAAVTATAAAAAAAMMKAAAAQP
jgi:hypothetical protein